MNKGIFFALLSAILWGLSPVLEKLGLCCETTPLLGVTVRSIAISIILVAVMIFTGQAGQIITMNKTSLLYIVAGGILAGLLGQLTYFTALKHSPSTLVVPIAATYPLVAMIISVIFLEEKFTFNKGLGTLFVVLGIAFLRN